MFKFLSFNIWHLKNIAASKYSVLIIVSLLYSDVIYIFIQHPDFFGKL